MMDLGSKLCKAGGLVYDTGTDTLAASEACLQLPEHRRFFGREKNTFYFQDALSIVCEGIRKAGFKFGV